MTPDTRQVVVIGTFDDIRSRHLRFLEEASGLGKLTVLLWPDAAVRELTGQPPKFPEAERLYFLNAVRYVSRVIPVTRVANPNELPDLDGFRPKCGWMSRIPATRRAGRFAGSAVWSIVFSRRTD